MAPRKYASLGLSKTQDPEVPCFVWTSKSRQWECVLASKRIQIEAFQVVIYIQKLHSVTLYIQAYNYIIVA